MKTAPLPTVAYVLTGGENSGISSALAMISVACLRTIHPDARAILLVDPATAATRNHVHDQLRDSFDEWITVETGTTEPVTSNRFIKTQLARYVEGPCVYLDNDTVPLRSLIGIHDPRFDFAAAPDYQSRKGMHVCPPRFQSLYELMGWEFPPKYYLNGGVFCYSAGERARELLDEWHRRWRKSLEAGHVVDQPALNSLWADANARVRVLPPSYNALIEADESLANGARVYHYTSSYARITEYILPELIEILDRGDSIAAEIKKLIQSRYIWKDRSHARRHWNTGHPLKALITAARKSMEGRASGNI